MYVKSRLLTSMFVLHVTVLWILRHYWALIQRVNLCFCFSRVEYHCCICNLLKYLSMRQQMYHLDDTLGWQSSFILDNISISMIVAKDVQGQFQPNWGRFMVEQGLQKHASPNINCVHQRTHRDRKMVLKRGNFHGLIHFGQKCHSHSHIIWQQGQN